MAAQRVVVLGAAAARMDAQLRTELLPAGLAGAEARVTLLHTERAISPGEWADTLDRIDEADTVVVVVSAGAVADLVWTRLVEHALAVGAGIVVLVADDAPLTSWPIALRDARPPMVTVSDRDWAKTLATMVRAAPADRAPGRPAPPRPPMPTEQDRFAPDRRPSDIERGAPAVDPSPIDDDVQFTLYRPAAVSPLRWQWLLVFAHKSEGGPDLDDPLAEVQRQAEGVLGDHADDYGALTADSRGSLRRGTNLLIEPWLDGATFNPRTIEVQWQEAVHRADFRFQMREDAPAVARGGVRIFAGVVLIGELTMTVRVGTGEDTSAPPQHTGRFRRIFASYSHADAVVVERIAAAVGLLGDEYIIDTRHLRSGDNWERQIEGFIEEADVFQLFWSTNALRSPYVLAECRHALSLQREGFIRPVFWEDPLPLDPEQDLPPAPIPELHFSRLDEAPEDRPGLVPPPPAPPPPTAQPPTAQPPTAQPPPPPPPAQGAAGPPPAVPEALPAVARPSTAPPPTRAAHRRSRVPWAAAAMVAVLGFGAGAFALQGGGGGEAAPVTTESSDIGSAVPTTDPVVVPTTVVPTTVVPTTGTEPVTTTVPNPDCEPEECLRLAFPIMEDGECRGTDALPDLESYAELCLRTSPSTGAAIRFRGAVTLAGLDAAAYLDQLGRRTSAPVGGRGRWTRDGAEVGSFVDFTWTAPEDPTPACRAWGEDGDELVAWVCAAEAATAIQFWETIVS